MRKSIKRWFLIIFLWLPLTLVTGKILLFGFGVCPSQARRWSDDELIEVAVRELAKVRVSYEGKIFKEMAVDDTEEAVQAFLKDNPRCCEVNRAPPTQSTLDLLFGTYRPEVEINYARHPDRIRKQTDNPYYKKYLSVTVCGEFIGKGIGTSTSTLEVTRHTYRSK